MTAYRIRTIATIGRSDTVAFGPAGILRAPCPGTHDYPVPAGTAGYVVRGRFSNYRRWRVFLEVPTGVQVLEFNDRDAQTCLRTEREGGRPQADPRGACIARDHAAWLKQEFRVIYHGD
jgi:hypothetical protein